jgi:hypothetical protein
MILPPTFPPMDMPPLLFGSSAIIVSCYPRQHKIVPNDTDRSAKPIVSLLRRDKPPGKSLAMTFVRLLRKKHSQRQVIEDMLILLYII